MVAILPTYTTSPLSKRHIDIITILNYMFDWQSGTTGKSIHMYNDAIIIIIHMELVYSYIQ